MSQYQKNFIFDKYFKNNEYSINALVKAPWLRTPINIIKKVQGNFFPDSIARYLKFVNTDNRNDRAE